jgi:hypothetical protein
MRKLSKDPLNGVNLDSPYMPMTCQLEQVQAALTNQNSILIRSAPASGKTSFALILEAALNASQRYDRVLRLTLLGVKDLEQHWVTLTGTTLNK